MPRPFAFRALLTPPWTAPRLRVAFAVWLAFALARAALSSFAAWRQDTMAFGWAEIARALAVQGAIALLWTALVPLVAACMRAGSRRGSGARLGLHAAGVTAAIVLDTVVRRGVLALLGVPAAVPVSITALFFADVNLAAWIAIALATSVLRMHDELVRRSRGALRLEAQRTEARLALLTAQLQPHFLFNSLGAVTELAHEAPAAAARVLRQLAVLLRTALRPGAGEIALRDELDALEPYLEIQRMRFADWLTVDVALAPDAAELVVPRLILQPLVENAIKHGLTARTRRGRLTITGSRIGGMLHVAVRDDGVGLRARRGGGRGIGLANVAERLVSLPGGPGTLELRDAPGGGTIAELRLPARAAGGPHAAREDAIAAADSAQVERGAILSRVYAHPVAATVLGCLAWGVVSVQQSLGWLAVRGQLSNDAVPGVIRSDLAGAAAWAFLVPLVLLAARRLPLTGRRLRSRLTTHAVLAAAFSLAHAAAWHLLAHGTLPGLPMVLSTIVSNCMTYAVVVGVGEYRGVLARAAAHAVEEERLRTAVVDAELRRATAAVRPRELVGRLEALADVVVRAPREAERALAVLALELRMLLDDARTSASPRLDVGAPFVTEVA